MEFLDGLSLNSLQRRLAKRGDVLPAHLSASIVADTAAGLHAAHRAESLEGKPLGIVHRDVSPQNIFLTLSGHVKVLDFGIAKAIDRLADTQTGTVKGKFGYMAPEQSLGHPIDARADIFALGVVFYELLVGRRLFRRESQAATMRAVLEAEILPPSHFQPQLNPTFDAIALRALSRDPEGRFATAEAFRHALLPLAHAGSVTVVDELAAVIEDVAEDRARMRDMVRARIARGEPVEPIEEPRDAEAEPPSVVELVPSGYESLTGPMALAAPRSRWRWLPVIIATVAAVGIALFLLLRPYPTEVTDAQTSQRQVLEPTPQPAIVEDETPYSSPPRRGQGSRGER